MQLLSYSALFILGNESMYVEIIICFNIAFYVPAKIIVIKHSFKSREQSNKNKSTVDIFVQS